MDTNSGSRTIDEIQGRIQKGGGGPEGQAPPFWGTSKLPKEGKTLHVCIRMQHVLVLKVRYQ